MNLKFGLNALKGSLHRRTLLLVVVVALAVAMLPTAAFASSGYGHQGRAWNPGPPEHNNQHPPTHNNHQQNNNSNQHNNNNNSHPSQCATTYRVQPGDSLSEIAAHFHVSVQALSKANGIHNPNVIYAGQVLCIPC